VGISKRDEFLGWSGISHPFVILFEIMKLFTLYSLVNTVGGGFGFFFVPAFLGILGPDSAGLADCG
jgi:hypothetical protein